MVKIFEDSKKIEYTRGDTFLIGIYPDNEETFPEGSVLDFIVAVETNKNPVISNTYNLKDGQFAIEFSKKDTQIPYGIYVYKMVLRMVDGSVITQQDGEFEVIWGA